MKSLLLLLGLGLSSPADAQEVCGDVTAIPKQIQVAWISPVGERTGSERYLEVVRLTDLRSWIRANQPDQTRLLQHLGLTGKRGGWRAQGRWKVTIFDVDSGWLCRPIQGAEPGETVSDMAVCHQRLQRGNHRFTGCGYTLDTANDERGIDHYRVQWQVAARWGFCVMPLERFLQGA